MTENENGNGYNGKFTAQQFINAMPGTGGVVSLIAAVVGCAWNTARKYIDEYPTVNRAWHNERSRINDKAKHNIIKSINDGDLQMSKWWLSVLDDEFKPKQSTELTGKDGGPIQTQDVTLTDDQRDRAVSSLARAITTRLHQDGAGGEDAVDTGE